MEDLKQKELRDLLDQVILATGYNLISAGQSDEYTINVLKDLGWGKEKAIFVVRQIHNSLPPEEPDRTVGVSLIVTIIAFAIGIYFWGDWVVLLPAFPLWRALAALGFVLIPLMFFLLGWALIYALLEGGDSMAKTDS